MHFFAKSFYKFFKKNFSSSIISEKLNISGWDHSADLLSRTNFIMKSLVNAEVSAEPLAFFQDYSRQEWALAKYEPKSNEPFCSLFFS